MSGSLVRPCLAIFAARFLMMLQYRAAALAGIATQFWFGAIMIMALSAFYASGRGSASITLAEAITYTWLGQAFLGLLPWNVDPEIALMMRTGNVNISFALADMVSRGFDVFGPQFVKTGDFDRLLLRPRATALQLLGYELRLTRLGRFLQGALVVGIAMGLLDLSWGVREVVLLLSAIAGGVALFLGLVVLQATLAFWTVESLEVVNTLTFGGVTAAQYPMAIYSKWLREFFTFVVTLSCVAYFPIVGILGINDPLGAPKWFLYASPLFGFVFLGISLMTWRLGERHYTSTGS